MGFRGRSAAAMGGLGWDSCGKTFSIGRIWIAIKQQTGDESGGYNGGGQHWEVTGAGS